MLIGALSQITENLRLGFGVTLMPHAFTPPMRVAEKVATADILSNGRIEWGTGRSTPMEQTAFGVDREASRAQWEEAIEAVVGMWESEYFEFHGKYLDFPRRMVTPKPVQDPHPPCWMAATSDGSAAVAGEKGLGLLSFSIMQPIERMAQQIEQYRKAAANPKPLTRVTTNKVAAYTLVHCTDTMAQAEANGIWDAVQWWYQHLAEFTLEWELPHFSEQERDEAFPLLKPMIEGEVDTRAFSEADMIVVGDPRPVLREDEALCGARSRPADLLRAVRPPLPRVDPADDRADRDEGAAGAREARRDDGTLRARVARPVARARDPL